jgi:hypothetical protein
MPAFGRLGNGVGVHPPGFFFIPAEDDLLLCAVVRVAGIV